MRSSEGEGAAKICILAYPIHYPPAQLAVEVSPWYILYLIASDVFFDQIYRKRSAGASRWTGACSGYCSVRLLALSKGTI